MGNARRAAIALVAAVGWSGVFSNGAAAVDPKPSDPVAKHTSVIPWTAEYYGPARAAVLSADGKTLWAMFHPIGGDLALAQFDAASGREIRKFPFTKGNLTGIGEVAVAPNQRILAAAVMMNSVPGVEGQIEQIRLWNLITGKELLTLGGLKTSVGQFSFSSDGKRLAACRRLFGGTRTTSEGVLRVWDLAASKVIFSQDEFDGYMHAAAISPDGKTLYWLAGKTLHVTDLATGKETATAAVTARDMPDNIAISPDGTTMVMSGQHLIEIWDAATLKSRKAVAVIPIGGGLPVFTSDSKTIAVAVYEKVAFFNSLTGEAIGAITAAQPRYVPKGVSISGDGKIMVVVGNGGVDGGVNLFDTSKLDPPPEFKSAVDAQTLFPPHIPRTRPPTSARADKIAQSEAKRAAEAAAKAAAKTAGTETAPADLPASTSPTPAPSSVASSTSAPPINPTDTTPAPKSPGPTKPDAIGADAFVGAWTANENGFRDTWTFSQNDGVWIIKAVYAKHGKEVGSAHGVDAKIVNGALTFTRIFDKKPHPGFSDDSPVVLEVSGGHLNYTANTGSKTKHLRLDRFGK
jgi:hypothetical protein